MKNSSIVQSAGFGLILVSLAAPGTSRAEDDLPKPLAFARYEQMLERSPFAVATADVPPPVAPDFAKDLFIANAAHSPDGDLITLASSSDKNFKKYLTTKEPVDGFSVSNIEWSDKVGATKVTITKEGQFATLGFNQALLTQPIQNPAPAPGPQPQPAVPPAAPTSVNPQIQYLQFPLLRPRRHPTTAKNARLIAPVVVGRVSAAIRASGIEIVTRGIFPAGVEVNVGVVPGIFW
jgi:hypothetical protein